MRIRAVSREAKLLELRRKTDRELIVLVPKEMDRRLRLVDTAMTPETELYVQAKRAYLMSEAWLSLIYDLDPDERRELEFRLKELKSVLERRRTEKCSGVPARCQHREGYQGKALAGPG